MDTVLTKDNYVSQKTFNEIAYKNIEPLIKEFNKGIGGLIKELSPLLNKTKLFEVEERKMSILLEEKCIVYDATEIWKEKDYDLDSKNVNGFMKNIKSKIKDELFDVLQFAVPNYTRLNKIMQEQQFKFRGRNTLCFCDDMSIKECYGKYALINEIIGASMSIGIFAKNIKPIMDSLDDDDDVCYLLVADLDFDLYIELIKKYIIPLDLRFEGISDESNEVLHGLYVLNKIFPDALVLNENNEIVFSLDDNMIKVLYDNFGKYDTESLHLEWLDLIQQYYDNKKIEVSQMYVKTLLLNCEKERADIEPYDEKMLSDPNRGHWDLWSDKNKSKYSVEFENEIVARNPICDVNENGVIAIDFGTKSTTVVYQNDIEQSLPMGIGDGNLSKDPTPKRYENPTVMHFVDLDGFLDAYNSGIGRPNTKWEDLTISHTAIEQFGNSNSDGYYEYLHQIKQWAGQREKQFRVSSHDGKSYVLPSFLDLDDKMWNPIEIYAYYIGLYINNMRKGHGIFLDYYLSFPVTYETKIREKIISSFEKGLKKSLPAIIVQNEEIMKKFRVHGDISEPAAYAVCALQEYGFEPEGDEEIFYGIFDFGGGTTDFDFGLWKQSDKRRYDYTIENFGAGGDEFLGGENLLEILAFEVFKANQSLMREKGYTFTLAPKCTEFLGSDSLLADSQEAEKNMHNLMEKIRPYWENNTSDIETPDNRKNKASSEKQNKAYDAEIEVLSVDKTIDDKIKDDETKEELEDNIKFVVTLFEKDGHDHPNEALYFDRNELDEIIEKRIREGVNNFFQALLNSYQNDKVKKPTTVNIFLAGNSCKSPVVKRVFDEAISKHEQQIKEKYSLDSDESFFEIFPPLGTEDAYKKMESRGLHPSRDDFEKPTGKTGVAFGLIQCREGGAIEIKHNTDEEEIPFQYFIGWRSKKRFVPFKDETKLTKYIGKPDYDKWYKFIEADALVFDLYYTSLPECTSGELLVDGNAAVKRLRCEIDCVDENAYVFIRAINPHTLEYVVSKDDNVKKNAMGSIVRKELS